MDSNTITLEYIGPPGQVDAENTVLVPGRRYQVEATLAAYRLEHDTGHWKRPEPPKPAAVKE